jgi:aminopeptidase N
MKVLLLAFIVCSSIFLKAQEIDVLHYKFVIFLSDKTDTLNGLAIIAFIHQTESPKVSVDLTSLNKEGKGMKVYAVGADTQSSSRLNFVQSGDKILVNHSKLKKGDTGTLYISYIGIPPDGLIISKNKFGDRTFFADNWPNRAHHWIPCVDRPDDKASFEFMVVAPAHYSVVSNGLKIKEEKLGNEMKLTHWKEGIPSSTKVMVIGVAKFATKTYDDSPKDIPVSAWFYPQDSTKGFYDYAVTPSILKFFADYIGPFPYKKLANVQSKTQFGGMENASCIFYNEDYVTGKRQYEDVMAHEIAHQWFGDMVSEKSFAHLWLSEGFADYFEHYYFEKKYGEEAARKKWEQAREEVISFASYSSKGVVDSTGDLMSLLNANSYKKGAWVLRMLRFEVGDSVFQNIIRSYYNQYKGSNAETRDFEAVAEKVSGKELTWFFDQWLYQSGIPKVGLSWNYNNKSINMVPYTILSENAYTFPLEVQVVYKDGSSEMHQFQWSPAGHFRTSFSAKEKPMKVILDPNKKLLLEEIKK